MYNNQRQKKMTLNKIINSVLITLLRMWKEEKKAINYTKQTKQSKKKKEINNKSTNMNIG